MSNGVLLTERPIFLTLTRDTKRLIEEMKLRAPEAWLRFCKTVDQEGIIDPDLDDIILEMTRALFPGLKLVQMSDLLIRMSSDCTRRE